MNASTASRPASARDVEHLLRLRGVRRERLFAQHVLAGAQGADRPLVVQAVGQRDVDRVDVAASASTSS